MTLTVIDIQYLHTLHLESPNIDDQLDIMIFIAYFQGGLNVTHKQTDSLTHRKENKNKAQMSAGYSQNHPKYSLKSYVGNFTC